MEPDGRNDDHSKSVRGPSASQDAADCDSFDPTDLPASAKFLRSLMLGLLFIYNYDMMAIYKETHTNRSRAKYRRFRVPELTLATSHWDKWRRRWWIFFLFLYLVVLVRFTTICFIQFTIYQATTTTIRGKQIRAETQLIKFLRQYKLLDVFHNALLDHPGPSLVVHVALMLSVSYTLVFLPYRYSRDPIDSTLMRFYIDPCREIKRIDLVLREKIEDLLMALEKYKQSKQNSKSRLLTNQFEMILGLKSAAEISSTVDHSIESTAAPPLSAPSRQVVPLKLEPTMRPRGFSRKYYKQLWTKTVAPSFVLIPLAILFLMFLLRNFVNSIVEIRCNNIDLHECSPSQMLDWLDVRSLFEMAIVMLSTGVMVTLQMISMSMHSKSQLHLIAGVRYYLQDLLNALRLINRDSHSPSPTTPTMVDTSEAEMRQPEKNAYHELRSPVSSVYGKTQPSETLALKQNGNSTISKHLAHLNDALLKALVRTRVSLDDFSCLANNMSEQVSSILMLLGSILILTIAVSRIEGNDMESTRARVIKSIWIGSNVLLVMCSHVYTKMIQLERLIWSLVAQLKTIAANNQRGADLELQFMINNWDNFASKQGASDARNSVRPFGISLTYDMVLKMNFFVITIAALVTK